MTCILFIVPCTTVATAYIIGKPWFGCICRCTPPDKSLYMLGIIYRYCSIVLAMKGPYRKVGSTCRCTGIGVVTVIGSANRRQRCYLYSVLVTFKTILPATAATET